MNFYIVSSTHWDREWYEPYEKYRFRLVRMMDALLEILEKDPKYKSFHADGQTIVLQDYLRIRPENAQRLAKLIKAGKIEIGPWYTMPEEWLVSGESLIKNLQTGRKICKEYGVEVSPCGYICDLFGHNSQMPQIFQQFGLQNTAFFRGVEDTNKDLIRWEGADGSVVTVQKMHRDYAYSTFYFVVRYPFEGREYDKKEIVKNFGDFLARETASGNFATENILLMDGVDHMDPDPKVPKLLELLRKAYPEHTFTKCDMKTYFDSVQSKLDSLEKVTGCLYDVAKSGVNQTVLKNCASSLVDQKQDNFCCETALEKVVSPLNFHLANTDGKENGKHYHTAAPYNGFFEEGWNLLLQNHAHDSICGCSVTATHLDTKNRFKHAREIVEVTQKNILNELASNLNTEREGFDGAWMVYNHAQEDVDGVCVVELPVTALPAGRNLRIFDSEGKQLDYAILERSTEFEKDTTYNQIIRFPEVEKLTMALDLKIPAGGYETLFFKRLKFEREPNHWECKSMPAPYRFGGSLRKSGWTFDTGAITVEVKSNGTLKVTNNQTGRTYKHLLCFEDCGDVGDGWNYVAPECDTAYSSLACDADIALEKDNGYAAVLRICNRMHLPVQADWSHRSEEKRDLFIENTITLLKGSSQILVRTKVKNDILNHRLRVLFPTGLDADTFQTKIPFDFYAWNVKKKDNTYAKEKDTYVNPNQGAMSIREGKDVFAVYNKGLYEIAVADDEDRTCALTLLRSFTNEVGCMNHTGLGTMQGTYTMEYAMDFLCDASGSEVLRRADAFRTGLTAFETGIHAGKLPVSQQIVDVKGNAVVSILQGNVERNGKVCNEIRIYDVDGGSEGTISFFKPIKKAYRTDLKGDILEECKVKGGKIAYQLKNRQIATYIFEF